MKVVSVINNNIITSVDENLREIIVTGRGLGFKVKKGEPVDKNRVEKIFCLSSRTKNDKLLDIISNIPLEHLEAADLIIEHAKKLLGDKLKETIYLSLIDHISCAIERLNADIMFTNPLLWEIKCYYPLEFRAGIESIALLKKNYGIKFPVDEAGFIAMHFITSEYETSMDVTMDIPKLVAQTVKIIENYFHGKVDQTSIHYERFITHLKFFVARVLKKEQIKDEEDDQLFQEMIRNQYKDCYQCVLKIKQYMENTYHVNVSEEEVVYLTVHIRRITMDMK